MVEGETHSLLLRRQVRAAHVLFVLDAVHNRAVRLQLVSRLPGVYSSVAVSVACACQSNLMIES
jgi:hypothetical protein